MGHRTVRSSSVLSQYRWRFSITLIALALWLASWLCWAAIAVCDTKAAIGIGNGAVQIMWLQREVVVSGFPDHDGFYFGMRSCRSLSELLRGLWPLGVVPTFHSDSHDLSLPLWTIVITTLLKTWWWPWREYRRRCHSRCANCGYPKGSASKCSECGQIL